MVAWRKPPRTHRHSSHSHRSSGSATVASVASWWRLQAEGKVCRSPGMGCHKEENQSPGFAPEPWEDGGPRRTRGLAWRMRSLILEEQRSRPRATVAFGGKGWPGETVGVFVFVAAANYCKHLFPTQCGGHKSETVSLGLGKHGKGCLPSRDPEEGLHWSFRLPELQPGAWPLLHPQSRQGCVLRLPHRPSALPAPCLLL